MRSFLPALVAMLLGCDPAPLVSCGPGTRLEGTRCVLDARGDAASSDASRPDAARLDAAPIGADGMSPDAGSELADGEPCPMDSAGNNLLSPGCAGDLMHYCSGTIVRVIDCTELGDRCVPSTGAVAAHCEGGVYGPCDLTTSRARCADAAHVLRCADGYPHARGFTYTIRCAAFGEGYGCLTNSRDEAACYPPGTVPCDIESRHCTADGSAIVTCSGGLEYTIACDDRIPDGVCALDGSGDPVCVPPGSIRCEQRTFRGSCVGDAIVEQCGITSHVELASCAPGARCRVSGAGFAGCVPEEAMSCELETHVARCVDRDRLAHCDGRGFESLFECRLVGAGARCVPEVPARCGVVTDCDPESYTAQCAGDRALNCAPGGWVEETMCSTFNPCRVVDGVARCAF